MPYDQLASVYEFTVPTALLTPSGSYAAFSSIVDGLPADAAILDCACGTGELAAGLAEAGYTVTATDASPAMVERAVRLARRTGVALETAVVPWAGLADRGWTQRFAAVFCVGNSLTHAAGADGRRQALANIRAVTADGGRLAITSRNWERVRAAGSRIEVAESVLERNGRSGILIRNWIVADTWDQRHDLHVAVALLDAAGESVTTVAEHLTFWPFQHQQLLAEIEEAGYTVERSTYEPAVDRYLVTAVR